MVMLADELEIEDFYQQRHQVFFKALLSLWAEKIGIDVVTILSKLSEEDKQMVPAAYIAEIAAYVPTSAHTLHYAKIVRQKAILRRLGTVSTRLASESYDAIADPLKLLEEGENEFAALTERARVNQQAEPVLALIDRTLEDVFANRDHAALTGFESIDEALQGGFKRGHLIVLGARTSVGKTSLGLNIALRRSRGGTLFISNEMNRAELVQRGISDLARIDWNEVRRRPDRQLWDTELERVMTARDTITAMNFDVVFQAKLRPRQVLAFARAASWRWEGKLDLVVIDYFQRMRADRRAERFDLELAQISDDLKSMAGELQCAVLLLAQLSRESVKRQDPEPTLEDLRHSGATEENADEVLLMWKPKERENLPEGTTYLTVAKQRNGPTPTLKLKFDARFTRFEEMAL